MNRVAVIALILMLSVILPGCIFPSEELPPEARLEVSATSINAKDTVILSANDSFDKDGKIVSYFWTLGDGTNASGKYVSHNYEKGGNYTVILIVTDDDNKKAIETITIHVNELPIPVISISQPAYIHEEVYFWANDSHDPDGFIAEYHWDFGDGENATGMTTSHVYISNGSFKAKLIVTDNEGAKATTWREFEVQLRKYNVTWEIDSYVVYESDPENENYTWEIRYSPLGKVEHLLVSMTKNITHVFFYLTWEDDYHPPDEPWGPNDEFFMNVTPTYGGIYIGGPDMDENISLRAPDTGYINELPWKGIREFEAESQESLKKQLAMNKNNIGENGTGDWKIDITITVAGGVNPFDPPWPPEQDSDTGNSWQLKVVCFYYWPDITRA